MLVNKYINKSNGYTIIELIVVVVVIGILASIILVVYGNITTRAQNSRNLANIVNVKKKIEIFREETGRYPDMICGSRKLCISTGPSTGTAIESLKYANFGYLSTWADPTKYTNYGAGGNEGNTVSDTYGYNVQFCRPDENSTVTGIRIYYPYDKKTASITIGSDEECV